MAIVFDLNTEIRTIEFQSDAPVDLPLDSLMVITAVRKSSPMPAESQEAVISREHASFTFSHDELSAITWEDAEWQ